MIEVCRDTLDIMRRELSVSSRSMHKAYSEQRNVSFLFFLYQVMIYRMADKT